ncbi:MULTISPECIES: shikimate dehydrogenase [unclassified Microcoleus]|jgi:shikimate dehydrogenase|uniref:shikimate dehydrogenase n=1 Tax=unclassified Microcoleus TaxID=2642155 RepID=UPI001DCF9068|nr:MULTISPECIES: shikimate dehydrogenase [unclassified Microcoleus]MCC3502538.1 shikimate dehydrogenase [Microcoleus sp. PH2017_19_SFW_U_A]TAE12448.1 MAG: shikimate dehydrogenase [Oscillatoriales cyanobacterium]MCC3448425.1 shikimate dehydrogenase [Microcoleus sp. PH2017_09_SFU_O_A]MCC3475487.1 shikimate dehydrogenase [Microcoleus sp. PH2017_13_LAR_U_A]MCC3487997.1 shikimate dehydrogenase [Microcoleus sp. PH2017_14_LAR_D_A]
MIKGTTKLLGVIGHPIAHSLSPVMHNAAISHLGVDFVYLPFPVKPEDLKAALAGFAAIDLRGFSITIPHKQAILPLLAEVSPIARAIGAVNTVYRTDKGWCGTNTDVEGFLAPLQTEGFPTFRSDSDPPQPPLRRGENSLKVPLLKGDLGGSPGLKTPLGRASDWSQKVAVILGNGGAARAVVAGCAQLGFAEIHVVGRNAPNLAEFQQSWVNSPMPMQNLQVHTWDNLSMLISQADLLVNTTPVGMHPHGEKSPVAAAALDRISAGAIVYDLIYTPNPTQLLKDAQLRGAIPIDGLEMLVQQGAAALKIWLDTEYVPVDVMRQALRQHLGLD